MVILSGEITGVNSVRLSKTLERYKKSRYNEIIIDLSGVGYVDSGCLGSLVYSQILLEKHGKKLILCAPHDYLEKIFRDASFNKVFEMIESYEDLK